MRRPFLFAKVHRAVVTAADLQYEGSLTLDTELMEAADLLPYQRIEVYNVTRGTRFATYLIAGPRGAGDCCINGAAAHLAGVGDRVIIAAYCDLEDHEVAAHRPRIVLVGEHNRIFQVKSAETAFATVP
ncbi:MAG: aspartate 1-decarboxylase [Acidobacteria bacterium]|nr:aspartate 1-decarboxylase [Acidobacteriota bacterium]